MDMMPTDPFEQALQKGNLQKAEFLCRQLLERGLEPVIALSQLARVATAIGAHDVAAQHYQAALLFTPTSAPLRAALREARASDRLSQAKALAAGPGLQPRYLLIKAWGYGFWSDLDHVASQLLLADLTGRLPVVHWGRNSLFREPDTDNAFESFFEPVSPIRASELARAEHRYYPAKWTAANLCQDDIGKWDGEGSRLSGLYMLRRDEEVVVSDYHTKVNDLIPWIPENSEYFGLARHQIYRRVFQKYIRLKPHLARGVEAQWQDHMAGRHWLAVHVRGSDKVLEMKHLDTVNQSYYDAIDQILTVNPSLSIFLLTDSSPVLERFQARYGERILSLDCQRSDSATGVHYAGHSGTQMGEQVIMDAWLAARCDFFLGNGGSNVSVGIRHLKSWTDGTFFLIGEDFLGQRNMMLHEW